MQPATVIAKVHQPPRPASVSAPPASFLIVDDQQPGTSRQLMFTLSLTKPANQPSFGSGQQDDSQHNTSGLSSHFSTIPSVVQYQQIDRLACIKSYQLTLLRATESFKNNYSAASCSPKIKKKHTVQHLHVPQYTLKIV